MAILDATIQQTPLGVNPLPEDILRTYARAGDPPNPNTGGGDIILERGQDFPRGDGNV